MREIKFKLWLPREKKMTHPFDITEMPDKTQVHDGVIYLQFAGMKDKNGTDIYEGDVGEIKTQSGRVERFVVDWGIHRRDMKSGWTVDIPGFCFRVDSFPTFPIANNYLNGHDLDIIEIIGNIYETPQLIQQ